jgi:cell division ATPase FtsA
MYNSEYENVTKLFLNLGNTNSSILLSQRGSPIFVRDIPFGSHHLIKDLKKELDIPIPIAIVGIIYIINIL